MPDPILTETPVDPAIKCDICDSVSVVGFSTPILLEGVQVGKIHCEACRDHIDDCMMLAAHRAIDAVMEALGIEAVIVATTAALEPFLTGTPVPMHCPHGVLVGWTYPDEPDRPPDNRMAGNCRYCSNQE